MPAGPLPSPTEHFRAPEQAPPAAARPRAGGDHEVLPRGHADEQLDATEQPVLEFGLELVQEFALKPPLDGGEVFVGDGALAARR